MKYQISIGTVFSNFVDLSLTAPSLHSAMRKMFRKTRYESWWLNQGLLPPSNSTSSHITRPSDETEMGELEWMVAGEQSGNGSARVVTQRTLQACGKSGEELVNIVWRDAEALHLTIPERRLALASVSLYLSNKSIISGASLSDIIGEFLSHITVNPALFSVATKLTYIPDAKEFEDLRGILLIPECINYMAEKKDLLKSRCMREDRRSLTVSEKLELVVPFDWTVTHRISSARSLRAPTSRPVPSSMDRTQTLDDSLSSDTDEHSGEDDSDESVMLLHRLQVSEKRLAEVHAVYLSVKDDLKTIREEIERRRGMNG